VDVILCMTLFALSQRSFYLHQEGSRLIVGADFTAHPQCRNNSAFPFKYLTVCVCVCVCMCVCVYIYSVYIYIYIYIYSSLYNSSFMEILLTKLV
jgi:hypothetical protein